MKKVDCQSLPQEAYSFTATKESLSLLWKLAAISYDKINENIKVPIPKHAWQIHVLSFPVMLHLSALTTICLHRFHLLCSSRTEPACSKKSPKFIPENFYLFLFCFLSAGMIDLSSEDFPLDQVTQVTIQITTNVINGPDY